MKMNKLMCRIYSVCILLLLFLITGCDKKIDTASVEKLNKSLEETKESLKNEKEKELFDIAIEAKESFLAGAAFAMALNGEDPGSPKAKKQMENKILKTYQSFQGKTGKDIAKEGIKIAQAELKDLKQKEKQSMKEKEALGKLEISNVSLRWIDQEFFTLDQPVVTLTIKNNSKQTISKIFIKASLKSPKRSIPWVSDDFEFNIAGGLEPGEQKIKTYEPTDFIWKDGQGKKDATLQLSVTELQGAGDEVLHKLEINEEDQNRIAKLEKLLA